LAAYADGADVRKFPKNQKLENMGTKLNFEKAQKAARAAAKIATNNAHKADAGSISFCMKRAAAFNDGFLEKLPFVSVGELKRKAIAPAELSVGELKRKAIAPAELIALMTEKEGQRFAKSVSFTVWGVMTLLGRLNAQRSAAAAKARGAK
jgi:hypothetical protein